MAAVDPVAPLGGFRVAELSTGIAGAYCTRLLADGGADVVKIEDPDGDPLRRWAAGGGRRLDPSAGDGALFRYLAGGKRSVTAEPRELDRVAAILAGCDAIVWSRGSRLAESAALRPEALRELAPHAPVLAITPFGLDGPWADRPSTEFTLQAWSGGISGRGEETRAPVSAGGHTGDWLTGMLGAVSLLSARWRALRTGTGELLDLSELEALVLTHTMYPVTYTWISGMPTYARRIKNFPGIEKAKDGHVAFMLVTGQQWLDFAAMVGRVDWLEDESLIRLEKRVVRRGELGPAIAAWMAERTVDEVIELAEAFRIPVAPVGNGATAPHFDHLAEGGYFTRHPDGTFIQPTPPYRLHHTSAAPRPPAPAPRLGEHNTSVGDLIPREAPAGGGAPTLPFEGLRVADFTAFWAGPILGHQLAILGADVIHVESTARVDGMRYRAARSFDSDLWWETGPSYHGGNTNKRGLTLDMNTETGRDLALRLIAECDVVVENYTPRVMENWGLTYERIREVKPDIIMVRMPGFGIGGPWRDRSGYAQTMEAVSGLAWLTGYPDEEPQVLNGPGDPSAGSHATIGLLLALEHRRRTGEGALVESAMVGASLAIAAEQVIEYSAYGNLLTRDGNRGPTAAPQNLYLAADATPDGNRDRWVAIAVETDEQWRQLCRVLGRDDWATDPGLAHRHGRRAAHDALDEGISRWCAERAADDIVAELWAAGVPVAIAIKAEEQQHLPQLRARGFFETVRHPVVGEVVHGGYPTRFSAGPDTINRTAAPTLGQHNREVLGGLLDLADAEIDRLEADGVIGTRPRR